MVALQPLMATGLFILTIKKEGIIMAVNFENVKNVSIEAKSLSVEYNAVQHAGLFGTLMIFGIPAVILISGFVVWYRRRKA